MSRPKFVSRTKTDTPKKWLLASLVLALGILLVVMSGCTPKGYVSAEALKGPVERLVERHDAYTDADVTLKQNKKNINKRDGELVLKVIYTALESEEEEE